jgi:hypothetical protein
MRTTTRSTAVPPRPEDHSVRKLVPFGASSKSRNANHRDNQVRTMGRKTATSRSVDTTAMSPLLPAGSSGTRVSGG